MNIWIEDDNGGSSGVMRTDGNGEISRPIAADPNLVNRRQDTCPFRPYNPRSGPLPSPAKDQSKADMRRSIQPPSRLKRLIGRQH